MALAISVNGTPRADYVRYRSLRIAKQGAIESCTIAFRDRDVTASAFRPDTGQPILVTREGGTLLDFGGEITRVRNQHLGPVGKGLTTVVVECRGWWFQAADVTIAYLAIPEQPLADTGIWLVATFLAAKGWTTPAMAPGGGPTVGAKVYVNVTLADIFDDLTERAERPWRVNGLQEFSFSGAVGTGAFTPVDYTDSNSVVLRNTLVWTKDRVRRATQLWVTTGGQSDWFGHHETYTANGTHTIFPVNVLPQEVPGAIADLAGYSSGATTLSITGLPADVTIPAGVTVRFGAHGPYTLANPATVDGAGNAVLDLTSGLTAAVVDKESLTLDPSALVTLDVNGTPTALDGSAGWTFDLAEAQLVKTGGAPVASTAVTYRPRVSLPAVVRSWTAACRDATGAFDYAEVVASSEVRSEETDLAATHAASLAKLAILDAEPKELHLSTFHPGHVYPWLRAVCDFPDELVSGEYIVKEVTLTDVGRKNQHPRVDLVLREATDMARDWRAFWKGLSAATSGGGRVGGGVSWSSGGGGTSDRLPVGTTVPFGGDNYNPLTVSTSWLNWPNLISTRLPPGDYVLRTPMHLLSAGTLEARLLNQDDGTTVLATTSTTQTGTLTDLNFDYPDDAFSISTPTNVLVQVRRASGSGKVKCGQATAVRV